MARKTKNLLLALAVLLLLGGGYYGSTVYKRKKDEAASTPQTAQLKLGNLEASKLVKIEVPGIVLEKRGEAWELTSFEGGPAPGGLDLDQSQISSLTFSLSSLWPDRIVEETPGDLSIYGLDNPSARAIVGDSDGKTAVYLRGDMAPDRTGYYAMEEGDPKVYVLPVFAAENLNFALDRIRVKTLFPAFEAPALVRLRVETPGTLIDVGVRPDTPRANLLFAFSSHLLNAPYKLPRGIDPEALSKLLAPLYNLAIVDFVEDSPASLAPYGLDKPAKIFLETNAQAIELLIGNEVDGKRYAKRGDAPGVFTLNGMSELINAKAFDLIDKFALLINIDNVDQLTMTGGEKPLSAGFQGKGDEGVYSLNGKKAETGSFKKFYQTAIGLLADAEYPGTAMLPASAGEITVEFKLNTPAGERASITLVPYDRDFYALRQEGTMEFLISRNQVRRIYEAADAVTYEEEARS